VQERKNTHVIIDTAITPKGSIREAGELRLKLIELLLGDMLIEIPSVLEEGYGSRVTKS